MLDEVKSGTTQRDVVRLGMVSIAVSFSVSPKWMKVLTGFKQRKKVSVEYFDTETLEMKDTSYKGLWKVSFTLKEF